MALPVIDSIVANPSSIPPGATSVVTITAHDPDAKIGTLTGTVTDSAGGVANLGVVLTIEDVLTYALVDTDQVGFTIVQRPTQPHVFDVTAP